MISVRAWAYLRCVLVAALLFFVASPASAAPFPKPTGFVTDTANLINPPERNSLESELKQLERQTTWEFQVVTIPTLDGATIERYAQDFFVKNGIGKKGKDNGVLLILAKQDRKVRIHTGFHAESVIPDAIGKRIILQKVSPKTKKEDWSGGILDGAHEIIRLIRAEHEHPGQAAARQSANQTIMGMSPIAFVFFLVTGLIILVLIIRFLGLGTFLSFLGDGGFYGGGGGGGGFSGGGGDAGGGGADGDC